VNETAGLLAVTAISLAAIALAAVSGWGNASHSSSRTYYDAVVLSPMRHAAGLHASLCDRQNARTSGDTIAAQLS
jgi:hypothetical protein